MLRSLTSRTASSLNLRIKLLRAVFVPPVSSSHLYLVNAKTGARQNSKSGAQDVSQLRLRTTPTAPPEIYKRNKGKSKSKINGTGTLRYQSEAPSAIDMSEVLRTAVSPPSDAVDVVVGSDRIESKLTDEQIAAAVAAAQAQPKSAAVQNLDGSQKPVGFKPGQNSDMSTRFDQFARISVGFSV